MQTAYNKTNEALQNRTAIKFDYLVVPESGNMSLFHGNDITICNVSGTKKRFEYGDFENTVIVYVEGPEGQSGPNVKPSQKAVNRLLGMIRFSPYKVIQQNGQHFTLEGEN